jgi:hypothetical protein
LFAFLAGAMGYDYLKEHRLRPIRRIGHRQSPDSAML